jgi:hypothetical protein
MTALTNAELKNGSADLTLTHASSAVSGSSDAISLDVTNVSAGTFTAASIETLTINSTLTNSKLTDVVIDGATALNVTGSADLQIVGDVDFKDNSTTTAIDGNVDASAFTGNLSIALNTGDIASVTGGSGDDFVDFSSGFTKADVVDGGAGSDTVTITNTTANAYSGMAISNVENFVYKATNGGNLDADDIAGITSLELKSTTGASDLSDLLTSMELTFTNSNSDMDTSATFKASSVTGADDAATVNVDGVEDGADLAFVGGVETFTINATGNASRFNDLEFGAGTTTLNINADVD